MDPIRADELVGNWATVLLPVDRDEEIDWDKLRSQVEYLATSGVSGIYTNGSAGEFYTQTEHEFEQIHTLVAAVCESHQVPFQIGANHMSPQISLGRIRKAASLGPSAIQVILPDWFPVTEAEAVEYLRRAAEAAGGIGLVLYNPPHSKRVLEPVEFANLKASVPALIGIKVADGDERWYAGMRRHCEGLSVFVPGHHLATGLSQGAHGSYSNMACLHPVGSQGWYELMHKDLDQALAVEARIKKFMGTYIRPFIVERSYSNPSVDKLLAAIGGWAAIGTRMRWPYRWIPEQEAERLRPIARELLPEFFPDI